MISLLVGIAIGGIFGISIGAVIGVWMSGTYRLVRLASGDEGRPQ